MKKLRFFIACFKESTAFRLNLVNTRYRKVILKRLLFIALLFVLPACGGDREDPQADQNPNAVNEVPPVLSPLPTQSASEEGANSKKGNDPSDAKTENGLVTTFFGKKYNRSLFEGMLKQKSIPSAVRYIQDAGVQIYIVGNSDLAPEPPAPLSEYYEMKRDELIKKKGMVIGGMGILPGFRYKDYLNEGEIFIIDDDVKLSLIAHEFLHILFERERRKSSSYGTYYDLISKGDHLIPELLKSFDEYQGREKGFFEFKETFEREKRELLIDLLNKLDDTVYLLEEMLINKYLEEALNEYLVLKEYLEGRLDIDRAGILTTLSYANDNMVEAIKLNESFLSAISPLRRVLQNDSANKDDEVAKKRIDDLKTRVLHIKTDMEKFSTAFKNDVTSEISQRFLGN